MPFNYLDGLAEARRLKRECRRINSELTQIERDLVMECNRIIRPTLNGQLTPREEEVLNALKDNPELGNKQVAALLNVSERTVKFHMRNLLVKFGATCRRELMSALEP